MMRTTAARHNDSTIARRAGAAVADNTYPLGRAARTASDWQESLHSRAAPNGTAADAWTDTTAVSPSHATLRPTPTPS